MEQEKSQDQIKFENTLLQLMLGPYRGYKLGSLGNIIHWLRGLGLQQYGTCTIGSKNNIGEVNLWGKVIATFVIDEKLQMPHFTFSKEYDWLQDKQENYINGLGKYPDPYKKYRTNDTQSLETAKEFLKNSNATGMAFNREAIEETMINFARMHVKAALEAAADNASTEVTEEYTNCNGDEYGNLYKKVILIDKDSILNAYPEDMIE